MIRRSSRENGTGKRMKEKQGKQQAIRRRGRGGLRGEKKD